MKDVLKNLDIRNQLTDELKKSWYYQAIKWGLNIKKTSVTFDESFNFKINYQPAIYAKETTDLIFDGEKIHTDKGELLSEDFLTLDFYIDGSKIETLAYYDKEVCLNELSEALNTILLYIANRI